MRTEHVDGRLESVNVGHPQTVTWRNQEISTSIFKQPVRERVTVRGVNIDGDDQSDRTVHGGVNQSVYAYAREDYEYWERELGFRLEAGIFGENLTTLGIAVSDALVGERWRVGTATLQITTPRIPCFKLAMRMDDPKFPKRFSQALRPGAYFRILTEGAVAAGDPITVIERPSHGVTVARFAEIYLRDRGRAQDLLAVPDLDSSWRAWAAKQAPSEPLQDSR